MDLEEIVGLLGLNKKESHVYVALLELGVASAYAIAYKCGLKRPTVYVVLGNLSEKGVVHLVPRSRKKLYRATSPEELLERARDRFNVIEENLPKLKAIQDKGAEKLSIEYYEGIEGMKEVLRYGNKQMASSEYVGFYASGSEEVQRRFGKFEEHNDNLKKYSIKTRGIIPMDPKLKYHREKDVEFSRSMKIVPSEKFSSSVAVEIGNTFSKIYDMKNLQGIVIENQNVAHTLRQIFEMVWQKT